MSDTARDQIRAIKDFWSLVKYLRDELDWPIEADDFEELTFDYEPEELGIDPSSAAKIYEIKQLRPLATNQPWGIFFLRFEPKRLPVVVLRRILSKLVIKKRTSAKKSEQAVWNLHDLLFISNYGEGEERQITFAHFSQNEEMGDLPTLKVLGWDDADTALHLDHVHQELKTKLRWPDNEKNFKSWREQWSSTFILRHREVITTSQELALRLAGLAQRIRNRVNGVLAFETERGPMRKLYKAFQVALIHDLEEDDFADMYAQTVAYGLLTARFSKPMGIIANNIIDMVPNTNPFLRDMLSTFITTGGRQNKIDFDELGIQEIVELLNSPDTHMDAVLRDFGNRTRQEDPVIHFYELFLSEYDKKKKVERGVFYTPQPVVSYIVRSVHELLQKEFGLADGLADITTWGEMAKRNKEIKIPAGVIPEEPFVQILDPAVGTATFLVEVIDVIYKTMMAKWKKQSRMALEFPKLWNEYVPKHLLPRLFGFELMMAPYAIAHMRLGLKLFETGYRFGEDTPRANIYLTNSLEPASDAALERIFKEWAPELAREARSVNEIKSNKRFTAVIANPPYAQMSANLTNFAIALVNPYRFINGQRIVEKSALSLERNLNDDYIKFLRLAEQQMENSYGVVGYITNNSYIDAITLRGLRWHLGKTFNSLKVLNLHGDSDKRDIALDGSPDENVFDIKKGVAVSLHVRPTTHNDSGSSPSGLVLVSDLRGTFEYKMQWLATQTGYNTKWTSVALQEPNYLFVVQEERPAAEYNRGISLIDLMPESATGFTSGYDEVLTGFEVPELAATLREFASQSINSHARFNVSGVFAKKTFQQRAMIAGDDNLCEQIKPFLFAPFDTRFTYYRRNMVMTASYRVGRNLLEGANIALMLMRQVSIASAFSHAFVTRYIPNNRAFYSTKGKVAYFPLLILPGRDGLRLGNDTPTPNLNASVAGPLTNRLTKSKNTLPAEAVMAYCYAILSSPNYRLRYDSLLRSDYPHIPIPLKESLGQALIELGMELLSLHLMESPKLNTPITNWRGSTPSNEVEKVTYSDETVWTDKGRVQGFKGVPENVWNFCIGGYQVCEKWLKDRRGRILSAEDIDHYKKIILAINETIKIMAEIDKVIDQHGGWPGAFL